MQNKSSTETQTPRLQRNAESVAIDGAEVVAQRGGVATYVKGGAVIVESVGEEAGAREGGGWCCVKTKTFVSSCSTIR